MKNIDTLFQELCDIDPSLQVYEAEVKKVLTKMMKHNPKAKMDKDFIASLNEEIMAKIEQKKSVDQMQTPKKRTAIHKIISSFFGGVVATLLVFTTVQYNPFNSTPESTQTALKMAMPAAEESLDMMAYDMDDSMEFNAVQEESIPAFDERMLSSKMAPGIGGGGGGFAPSEMSIMPVEPMPMKQYHYVLSDTSFSLPVSVEVIEAKNQAFTAIDVSNVIIGLDTPINVNAFTDLEMTNISLTEDKKFGHTVYVDFKNGNISIHENWETWGEAANLKKSEVPSDTKLIATATEFLAKLGIDMKAYGDPVVQKYWEDSPYARTVDTVGNTVSIVFPQLINGAELYDQGGNPQGLMLTVDMKENKVRSLYGLQNRNYTADFAEAASRNEVESYISLEDQYFIPDYQEVEKVEVELGRPEQVLATYWSYDQKSNINTEKIVPSLKFPIVTQRDDIYRKFLLVPLEKELIQKSIEERKQWQSGQPEIMPY